MGTNNSPPIQRMNNSQKVSFGAATDSDYKENEPDFMCAAVESVDVSDLEIQKNKKLFDIRKSGKRLWIKCDNVTIKYGHSANQYKAVEAKEGTFVLNVDADLRNVVNAIDQCVVNEFAKMYKGTILNNIMMTPRTLSGMFRPSLYNGTLRLYVSPMNCGVFRSDRSKVVEPDMDNILREDLSLGVVIEPAFAWMMNQKIGIHWDCRQVKLHSYLDKKAKKTSMLTNTAQTTNANVTKPSTVLKEPYVLPKAPKRSMLTLTDDEEDDDNVHKRKVQKISATKEATKKIYSGDSEETDCAQVAKLPSEVAQKWSICLDSDEE